MKQIIISIGFLFLGLSVFGQQPEKIYSIIRVQKDHAYYNEQAELWKKEVKRAPKDNDAWFNYYTAARMSNMFAGAEDTRYDIDEIAETLKTNLPNTFEYHYVSFARSNRDPEGFAHLDKAYAIDPERFEPWNSFITKAELQGDKEAMKPFYEKWYRHELYSPGITSWNYNVLIGLDQDALLLTFGDNDTYPLWFLQTVKNIRPDVNVTNVALLSYPEYQKRKFEELGIPAFEKTMEELGGYENYRDAMMAHILKNVNRPAYIGISSPQSFRADYKDQLYLVGLAFKYSMQDFDHVAVIRKNYESLFLKDYIKSNLTNDFSQSVVDYMNQQYIPCLTVLYKHYRLSGETAKSQEVKDLLLKIGSTSDRQESIETFFKNFEN